MLCCISQHTLLGLFPKALKCYISALTTDAKQNWREYNNVNMCEEPGF